MPSTCNWWWQDAPPPRRSKVNRSSPQWQPLITVVVCCHDLLAHPPAPYPVPAHTRGSARVRGLVDTVMGADATDFNTALKLNPAPGTCVIFRSGRLFQRLGSCQVVPSSFRLCHLAVTSQLKNVPVALPSDQALSCPFILLLLLP